MIQIRDKILEILKSYQEKKKKVEKGKPETKGNLKD